MPYDVLKEWIELNKACAALHLKAPKDGITVAVGEHKLRYWREGRLWLEYDCSTSKKPCSNIADSLGTPLGLHRVARKIGAGEPCGMVFVARMPTGECYGERADAGAGQRALVTTRILWLEGLQKGVNRGPGCDSFARYIYIHGSNFQSRIPEPLSAGCVLLKDPDLLHLFDAVDTGTLVWIYKSLPCNHTSATES